MPRLKLTRRARRALLENYGLPVLTTLGALLVWRAAPKVFHVPVGLVPAPSDILAALMERGGGLWIHIWITFYETVLGFLLAIALGVPLAVLIVHSRILGNAVYPLILITQSIPKVAFAPQLSASQFQIYTKIRFPSALPHFFSGLKVAITLAVIGAVIGEFVGSEAGLGFLVIQATSHFKTPMAFGAMSLLALM